MKRYNQILKRYIIINDGEKLCNKCHGKGIVPQKPGNKFVKVALVCDQCRGDGKIDWVEQVIGKHKVLQNK